MIASQELCRMLQQQDLTFLTGVPDTGLRDFLVYVENRGQGMNHVRAANEGQAIAIAAGYHLATKKVPVVYFQNSGLGNAINPLTSLADKEVYGIPMILFIAWRGKPDEHDEPQHKKMGRVMLDLLNVLEIPFEVIKEDSIGVNSQLAQLKTLAQQTQHPVALIFPKGVIVKEDMPIEVRGGEMLREEALEMLVDKIGSNPIVSTTGYTSRELFEIRERKGHGHHLDFLTVGSMGHASSIALGIVQHSKKPVYIVDGDGALLMHMGSAAAIGAYAPKNLFHVVIDNGAHESTGGQPTVHQQIDWRGLFQAMGYKSIELIDRKEHLEGFDFADLSSPAALVIKVRQGTRSDLGRPTNTPQENKEAFMRFLGEE